MEHKIKTESISKPQKWQLSHYNSCINLALKHYLLVGNFVWTRFYTEWVDYFLIKKKFVEGLMYLFL